MKIYIISDDFKNSISASNIIGSTGNGSVISETKSEDVRELLGDLKANIDSGFDLMLLMCHGAKDVAISANKLAGVRAVVCKDQEDAIEAVGYTRANVILIDTGRVPRNGLESIIEGLLTQQEEPAPASAPSPVPSRRRQAEEAPVHEAHPQPVYEPKGPGMFSTLKDKLGSVTQRNQQQKPIQQSKAKPAAAKGSVKDDARDFVKSTKQKGLVKTLKETFGVED
jgi:ribose 5-phosphate isomerase RpiB